MYIILKNVYWLIFLLGSLSSNNAQPRDVCQDSSPSEELLASFIFMTRQETRRVFLQPDGHTTGSGWESILGLEFLSTVN